MAIDSLPPFDHQGKCRSFKIYAGFPSKARITILRAVSLLLWLLTLPLAAEPVISEFLADNETGLADEDGDRSDWIEIHNPAPLEIDLSGWHLTDDASRPARWTFPAISLAPDARLVVFASGKNRAVAGGALHTNFSLKSEGEYLALVRTDMTVAQEFSPAFPAMDPDRSFGPVGAGSQFFLSPTPGLPNSGPAGRGFVKVVSASPQRGFYSVPISVSLSTATPGASIFYTTNGATPTASTGFPYLAPLVLSRTTTLRAVAVLKGWTSSPVLTQTYLFLEDVIRQSPGGEPPPAWPAGSVGPQQLDMGWIRMW
jgi:Chitobiase/beta-hexosaminidase C-terminal domain/Lamin Tail Domain